MTEQGAAPRTRTYESGDWYGVVGPDVLVLLPPEEKHRVATIWALADGGAGFDETLDALISGGLRDLHGFVLVSASEGDTKVVIRGEARAEFTAGGESVVLEGSSATTWVERSLHDVVSMALVVGDTPAGAASYVMELGLVRVSRLAEGAAAGPAPAVGAAAPLAAGVVAADEPDDAATADEQAGDDVLASDPVDLPDAVAASGTAAPGLVAVPAGADFDESDDESDDDSDDGPDGSDGSDPDEQDAAAEPVEPVAPTETTDGDGPLVVDEAAEEHDDPMVDPQAEVAPETEPDTGPETEPDTGPETEPDVDPGIDPGIDPSVDAAPLADEGAEEAPSPSSFESSFALVPDVETPEAPDAPVDAPADAPVDAEDEQETGLMPVVPADDDTPEAPRAPDTPDAPEAQPVLDLGPTEAFDPSALDDEPPAPGAGGPEVDTTWAPDHDGATTMQPSDPLPPVDDDPASRWQVDHDGATSMSPFESDDYELARPGIAGQPPAPPLTTRPVARLEVSTGESIDVDRIVVLGRAPMARRYAPDEHPVLITVPSPHQEISSTHAEVRPGAGADHGTAVVTDLGSTNGTVVTQPGLEPDELQPGISVQLIPGAVIDLGDGVTITVTRP